MATSGVPLEYLRDSEIDNLVVGTQLTKRSPFFSATSGVESVPLVPTIPTIVAFPTTLQTSGNMRYSAGVVTVPTAGFYRVCANVVFNSVAGTGSRFIEVANITKVVSQWTSVPVTVTNVPCPMSTTAVLLCSAGDQLVVRAQAFIDAPTINGAASPALGYLTVERLDF
jgi:hypothetical protein